jgi:hypothetical protein
MATHLREETSSTSIERGRPSYTWRRGQDRRLEMVRRFVDLEGAAILDVGCGIGTYVRRFRRYSEVRVTKPGGAVVAFAPNRQYPFETHGAYFGGRYVFGNIPIVNWLPDPLRQRFAPHVRAYTQQGIRSLFAGQPVRVVHHRVIYPGFDNVSSRHPYFGRVLRRALYAAERSPLHLFGLSHFIVLRKRDRQVHVRTLPADA